MTPFQLRTALAKRAQGADRVSVMPCEGTAFSHNGIDRTDVSCGRLDRLKKWNGCHFMGNGYTGAAKVPKSAKTLNRLTDRLHTEGQIDEVQPKFRNCSIVNGGGEGMVEGIADEPAVRGRAGGGDGRSVAGSVGVDPYPDVVPYCT